jgi:hypothetical protein
MNKLNQGKFTCDLRADVRANTAKGKKAGPADLRVSQTARDRELTFEV